ncbi:hypothetical protein R6Q57_013792 [Mikania cordata]
MKGRFYEKNIILYGIRAKTLISRSLSIFRPISHPPASLIFTMDTKIYPALTVSNIKTLIPVVLGTENNPYGSWSELFRIHCRVYQAYDHLQLKPTPPPPTADAD